MTKKNEKDLLVVRDLLDELYDREYSFDSADMMGVLPTPRDYTIIPKYRNLTKEWIKHFTIDLDIIDYVHYAGSFFFGAQNSGKTTFSEQVAIIMDEYYQDKLIILRSMDMQSAIDFIDKMPYKEKNQKVFFIIIEDALVKQSRTDNTKKIVQGLSIIRRFVDGENDPTKDKKYKMRGILYVNFNTQLLYFLDKDIRSMLKYRAFKSRSGSKSDIDKYFRPTLGDDLYKLLSKIDRSSEKPSHKMKHITIVDMNGEVGYIILDNFDEEKLAEIREKIIFLAPIIDSTYKKEHEITEESNIPEGFWKRIKEIFIEELYTKKSKRRKIDYLSVAKQVIGDSTLKRNIRLFYLKYFEGYDNNALEKEIKKLGTKGSARVTATKAKNFLKKNSAFKAIISERFFLELLRNSTVLSPLSFVVKTKKWFLKSLGATHHPDLYVERGGALVAVLAV